MTTLEIIYLAAGLWLGMGFTSWVVPFYASPDEEELWVDALVLLICLALGPIAVAMFARFQREEYR